MLFCTLYSCKALRPTAGGPKRQGGNNRDNDEANGKTSSNSTVVFTGTLIKDVVYASGTDYTGKNQQLTLDVYKPANAEGKKFPVVFLIHGGSFRGGSKNGLAATCSAIANNGYVVIQRNQKYSLLTLDGLSKIPMVYDYLTYDTFNNRYIALKKSEWITLNP